MSLVLVLLKIVGVWLVLSSAFCAAFIALRLRATRSRRQLVLDVFDGKAVR